MSHGLHAALGYGPDRLDALQERAFRAATLQQTPGMGMLFWSGIELPSPSPSPREIEALADAAIRLAAHSVPATPELTATRQLRDEGATLRTWRVGFTRGGVHLSPARCLLSVESGSTSCATLSCRIPEQTVTRFEPFPRPDAVALARARTASGLLRAPYADLERRYVATASLAQARFYVVRSNSVHERIVILDGSANVLTVGDNTRPFSFRGYEPDYTAEPRTLDAAIPVGAGQTILDTAPVEPGRVSCKPPSTAAAYPSGFAICWNDALRDPVTGKYTQPLVAARLDYEAPTAQELFFNADIAGASAVHGSFWEVTSRPTDPIALRDYARQFPDQASQRPYGPAHHAELQAYYTAAKLQQFYRLLDARFSPDGQDRFRTELTVHWDPTLDDIPNQSKYNAARAGQTLIRMGDFGAGSSASVADGTGERSIFAHEYHHHIQESLAKDDKWTRFGGTDVLFPFSEPQCTPKPSCTRRVEILEGLADAFASAEVERGVIGTLAAPASALPALLSSCDDREGYGGGAGQVRSLCNDAVFGYWSSSEDDACSAPGQQYTPLRRLVIGGALHLYQERLREGGKGPAVHGQHMLEAERALKKLDDNEIIYLQYLIEYLRAQPSVLTRRYEHTARAAFAEKGVFSAHAVLAVGGGAVADIDARQRFSCGAQSTDPNFCAPSKARAVSALTLTASGPLRWNHDPDAVDAPLPTFDLFAPIGTAYQSSGANAVVWLELSDAPTFSTAGYFARVELNIDWFQRVNCAPSGFARRVAPDAEWRDAVRAAAGGEGRVYYRLRQCLAGADVDDPNDCVVSTTATSPAFTTVNLAGTGCTCRTAGVSGGGAAPWAGALLLAALGLGRRRRRRP